LTPKLQSVNLQRPPLGGLLLWVPLDGTPKC
jgi:hypothetical protein